jgi:RluA family pseudouridine synthase
VRAGWRLDRQLPQTTEPDVNAAVTFLYEDDALVAVNKPAPLPMHACGRFNLNSLSHLLGKVFAGEQLRILHRLDANTTGVVLFARKKNVAAPIHEQFKAGTVQKIYLAKINGHPSGDKFTCDAKIADTRQAAGSRAVDADGQPAHTDFEVVDRSDDGTSLVRCYPQTGRTNQIRLHLSHLGFPIVGDPTYGEGGEVNAKQSLTVDDPPMCLHALSLTITHPVSNKKIEFKAPQPAWAAGI